MLTPSYPTKMMVSKVSCRRYLLPHMNTLLTHFAAGDTAFKAPVNAFNANLAPLRERLGHQESISPSNHDKRSPHLSSHSTVAESGSAEPLITVRFGSHYLPFPGPAEYLRYRTFFFDDINPCHPCVNEADFNAKCQKLLVTGVINSADACTLALNYIIFACTDILRDTSPAQEKSRLPGWRWYHAADELMRMRKLSGRGDLTLVQYLVYEVCLAVSLAPATPPVV